MIEIRCECGRLLSSHRRDDLELLYRRHLATRQHLEIWGVLTRGTDA